MKKRISALLLSALALSLLCACGGSGGASAEPVDLAAFAQSLLEEHQFSIGVERADPTDEEFGAIMLENTYPGLKDMDLEQMEVYLCMVSFNTGEFALVQAKSDEDAEKVRDIFQAHIDAMTEEGMNYPATVEMWQQNAQVAVNGSYVLLVAHEDCAAIVDEFNALFA